MTYSMSILVGNTCLAVDSSDPHFSDYFLRLYCRSIFHGNPDFSIMIEVLENLEPGDLPGKLYDYRAREQVFSDGTFSLYDHLIHGEVDLAGQHCTVCVEIALLAGECFSLFQDFLFRDLPYYVSRFSNGGEDANAFLVHGCCMIHDGGGFLFLGPSGAGKSAIAWVSTGDRVLHDEAVMVRKSEGLYIAETTPYDTDIDCCAADCQAPLRGIFFLAKDHANSVEAITRPDAVSRMFRQVVPPLAHDARSRARIMDENLSFAVRVIENVPHYQLRFSNRDDSFWKEIDALYG